MNALEPTGPLKAPEIVVAKGVEPDSLTKRYIESFKKPEARAEDAIDFILDALRAPRMNEEELKKLEAAHPSLAYAFYGIADAARDLAVKPQVETVPVKINLGLGLTAGKTTPVTISMPQSLFEELKRREEL